MDGLKIGSVKVRLNSTWFFSLFKVILENSCIPPSKTLSQFLLECCIKGEI